MVDEMAVVESKKRVSPSMYEAQSSIYEKRILGINEFSSALQWTLDLEVLNEDPFMVTNNLSSL